MIHSFAGLVLLVTILVPLLVTTGSLVLYFASRLRELRPAKACAASVDLAGRYKPMLRLLSEDDFLLVSADAGLRNKLRSERRKLFRTYLHCLTRDYGRLLEGIRVAMVESNVDRPDLARALAKNRALFALALCKVEFRLTLHAAGFGKVEIGVLVDALDTLRSQVAAFSTPPLAVN